MTEQRGCIMASKKEKSKERYHSAKDSVLLLGQYLILQEDCPKVVRDAWRTLSEYVYKKED